MIRVPLVLATLGLVAVMFAVMLGALWLLGQIAPYSH